MTQKFKTVVFYAAGCNSVLCMLAIAVERWRTLSVAIQYRGDKIYHAKIIMLIGCVIAIAYAVVLSYVTNTTAVPLEFEDSSDDACWSYRTAANRTTCIDFTICYPVDRETLREMEIFHLATLIIIFIFPVSTISVVYAILVTRLLISNSDNGTKNRRGISNTRRAKLRAIQAMIVNVVIFAVCWLPGHIFCVWSIHTSREESINFQVPSSYRVPISRRIFNDLAIHLSLMHHWIHTLIYPRYSRQIAGAIKETFFSFASSELPTSQQVPKPAHASQPAIISTSF